MAQVRGEPDCNSQDSTQQISVDFSNSFQPQGGLLSLPTELVHNVLLSLSPLCIEHFSQTCKLARHYVYGSENKGELHLWKHLYLQRFDMNESLWSVPENKDDNHASRAANQFPLPSIMELVQTRDRASRLYSGDSSKQAPLALFFNSALSALLSVIDTAIPASDLPSSCSRSSQWMDAAIITDNKLNWSRWLFPRNLIHSLRRFKADIRLRANELQGPNGQEVKRRRFGAELKASEGAGPSSHSPQSPSKPKTRNGSDTNRRRSARLMKIMYPEELHDLIDEGIDIESFAEPEIRLAARLHCLHGIRTWKDSQKQRQTTSPQEIPGQSQAEPEVGAGRSNVTEATSTSQVPPAPLDNDTTSQEMQEQASDDAQEVLDNPLDDFDEPPEAILTFRPRIFGPTFGFCNASDEEDKVRARMRELVYDAGNYSWSNSYGPLHAWRISDEPEIDEDSDDEMPDDGAAAGHTGGWGSDLEEDDAASILDENDYDDEIVPDDPIPIEIEGSSDEEHRPTFRLSDRYGNPVSSTSDRVAAPLNWDSSDDEEPQPDSEPEGDLPEVTENDDEMSENAEGEQDQDSNMLDIVIDADDFDEQDDDFDATDQEDDDDDDMISVDFDPWTPMSSDALTRSHTGSYARQEIEDYQKKETAAAEEQNRAVLWDCVTTGGGLRKKTVHWELLEAIMVVMYANLKEAIWLEDWGVGIKIPKIFHADGVLVRDPMEDREFLNFPTGWASSLPSPLPCKPRNKTQDTTQCNGNEDSAMQNAEKPHDWARCESFWGGTYSFLDYRNFLYFNAQVARRAREEAAKSQNGPLGGKTGRDGKTGSSLSKSRATTGTNKSSTPAPSLLGHEEAVGDCLQLRMELLPKHLAPPHNDAEEGQPEDSEYPTLHFRGCTVTYWGTEAPVARGGVHGKVRPIYAPEGAPGTKRVIEGIHWSLTHVYDGEDRWQLEGIQPGPPGTKAPIYGIWTDAMHAGASPNGPFVYWMMDERPWTEIERLNKQDEQATSNRSARFGTTVAS